MEIRPVVLRQELMESYREVQLQIDEVKDRASIMDIRPQQLRDANGNWVYIPLLAARVQILHALVMINQKDR
jgi:hypothetical protein